MNSLRRSCRDLGVGLRQPRFFGLAANVKSSTAPHFRKSLRVQFTYPYPFIRSQLASVHFNQSIRTMVTVRQITQTDIDQNKNLLQDLTDSISTAFLEDGFTSVALGGNKDLIPPLKRAQILSGLEGGEVWAAEEDGKVAAVAVWFGPGRAMFDTPEQKKNLLGPVFDQIEPDVKAWWGQYFLPKYAELTDGAFGPGVKLASWHLQTIGVLPEYRGKGILRHLIDAVKSKKETLCLEAISAANEKKYSHLGFQTQGEQLFVGKHGEFTFWPMIIPAVKA